jgi:hypothetical protein
MTNVTPSRLGAANGAVANFAQKNALFLKVFAGEVLTAFDETNVMKDLHVSRTISSGKSAQFPVTGKANAAYHVVGTPLLGTQNIKHNEIVVNIDDVLIADTFIANIDEAKNHYDVRAEYSRLLGMALAKQFDVRCLQLGVLAARGAATVTGGNGGTAITDSDAATNGASLAASIFAAAQAMDEKDVPENDRVAIVKPAQYYQLVQTTDVINRDFGGAGVYADGTVLRVAGIQIVKSNNVPTTNVASATAGENNTYHGNFSTTVALVMQKSAIGTVKLMDLAVERTSGDFEIMYQGTLMAAKYAMGHGILRPECAVEIKSS